MLNSSTLFEYNGRLMCMHKLPCHYFVTVNLHYCYSYLVTNVSIYIYVSVSPYSLTALPSPLPSLPVDCTTDWYTPETVYVLEPEEENGARGNANREIRRHSGRRNR